MDFDNIKKPLGVNSLKWLPAEQNHNWICLSISDLDFKTPSCVIDSVMQKLNDQYFGYTTLQNVDINQVLTKWFNTQHNWDLSTSSIQLVDRISQGVKYAINTFTNEGDGIIVQDPIYSAFRIWITSLNRKIIDNRLIRNAQGEYSLDFEQLEKQLSDNNTTMLLLCNPHNPTGRAWTQDELRRIGEMCRRYNVTIVSDDAHCEVHRSNIAYTPIAKVCPNNKIITMISPAKAFNTASLSIAVMIFSNKELMQQVSANPITQPNRNSLSIAALVGAYNNGEDYILQLNNYIDENVRYFKDWLTHNFPYIPFTTPDATYLAWIDISSTGKTASEVQEICKEHGVFVVNGTRYGADGKNFIRINLGTSRQILQEGLERITKAIKTIGLPR